MEPRDPYEIAETICVDLKGQVGTNLREEIEGAIAEALKEEREKNKLLLISTLNEVFWIAEGFCHARDAQKAIKEKILDAGGEVSLLPPWGEQ